MTPQRESQAPGVVGERRGIAVRAGLKLLGVFVLNFALLRLWAPDLVNMHKDWALFASLGCVVLAIAALIWLGFQLSADWSLWTRLDPRAASRAAHWRDK